VESSLKWSLFRFFCLHALGSKTPSGSVFFRTRLLCFLLPSRFLQQLVQACFLRFYWLVRLVRLVRFLD
jgi:hypothetical protein